MDLATILGFVVALVMILGGQALEGGHAGSIIALPAALIVLGGTVGSVLVAYPLEEVKKGLLALRSVFERDRPDPERVLRELIRMARIARRDGLLALESEIPKVSDPFLRKAASQVVDGFDEAVLRDTLEAHLAIEEDDLEIGAKVWETAGGVCPTIGIVGAVLGLIHTMENLNEPSQIGAGIASAFVATFYGVGAANLFFLPFANKIRRKIHERMRVGEMIMQGILSVQAGQNPHLIESRLRVYLDPKALPAEPVAAAESAKA